MKYKEPIKGKGIRNLFKSRGYQIYLVDEFRTSCKCANCEGGCCEKFMFRKSPKSFRKNNNLRLVQGFSSVKLVIVYGIEIVMEQQISTK